MVYSTDSKYPTPNENRNKAAAYGKIMSMHGLKGMRNTISITTYATKEYPKFVKAVKHLDRGNIPIGSLDFTSMLLLSTKEVIAALVAPVNRLQKMLPVK